MKPMSFGNEHALGRQLLSAFQPEFLPRHERRMQAFRFREPELRGKMRAGVRLATTDIFCANTRCSRWVRARAYTCMPPWTACGWC
ncbi:MAG: hypothetical protein FJY55_13590 [Betaproteobacteria bacterium]|nr:hypothetical protein [Betaproteobacteria bacterium]